jgi:hypothetical protein
LPEAFHDAIRSYPNPLFALPLQHAVAIGTGPQNRGFPAEVSALRVRYAKAKAVRRVARYSNNYDITSRCNFFCEGCYYSWVAEPISSAGWTSASDVDVP